jgi:hypothetical protein
MRRRVPCRSSVSSKFSDRCRVSGGDGRRDAFGVSAAELVADRSQLALLEFADGNPAPPLGGADDGGIHQLQHRPLAERVRDDFRPPALFEEQPLEQIRGADDAAMAEREAEMAMHASKSSVKHCTTAGSSRSFVCTKSSRSTVASAEHAA